MVRSLKVTPCGLLDVNIRLLTHQLMVHCMWSGCGDDSSNFVAGFWMLQESAAVPGHRSKTDAQQHPVGVFLHVSDFWHVPTALSPQIILRLSKGKLSPLVSPYIWTLFQAVLSCEETGLFDVDVFCVLLYDFVCMYITDYISVCRLLPYPYLAS